ncbi:hypothetical protein [Bacillus sp. FJAT-50079]|uniref:hypothetical protein n=1 Tax=Bacillus sp. FJAT-50079 TaxID=2833577 RepID=UPI001BCA15B1|nr:hypothetical protein [Bacillus sp. FJAT-50079]MBS4210714.1 hypothetical protein [Bacillus sp. FJAT-50079]
MKKKKFDHEFLPDTMHEGRNEMYVDVDRMINEGMSGGSVHMREDYTNIEEAIDFSPEDPPQSYE